MDALQPIAEFFTTARGWAVLRALAFVTGGWLLARAVAGLLMRALVGVLDDQRRFLVRRTALYAILLLAGCSALLELGFNLGVLLGAAGILTVALGFASQTSASNVISGLFLIGESPFAIGDVIRVGDITGEVLSIDLLSVKLRTFDNLYVRVPNESLIKSNVVNMTRFPIRRLDLQIGVAYKEDLEAVREVLEGVADANPICLDEPRPLFIFQGFGDSALTIQFSVWATRENWIALRNTVPADIKRAFDAAGIQIPFPQRTLTMDESLPVHIVDGPARPPTD